MSPIILVFINFLHISQMQIVKWYWNNLYWAKVRYSSSLKISHLVGYFHQKTEKTPQEDNGAGAG